MSRGQKNKRRDLAQARALETTVEETPVQPSQLSGYSYLAHAILGPRYKTILGAGLAATITLLAATPILSPGTSYREIKQDISSLFQSNEPDYDALWDKGAQDLFGRPAKTDAEEIELLKYVQSGKVHLPKPQHEIRNLTGDPSEYGEPVIREEYISNGSAPQCTKTKCFLPTQELYTTN